MAKKITAVVRLQIEAGKANPAPPVGPALGQHGINIVQFCKEYNARTQAQAGMVIPAEITIYSDRSFTFVTRTPPAKNLLLKAAGVPRGSAVPPKTMAGSVTRAQLREIATLKLKDLNALDVDSAMRIIEGTAQSMGISIKD